MSYFLIPRLPAGSLTIQFDSDTSDRALATYPRLKDFNSHKTVLNLDTDCTGTDAGMGAGGGCPRVPTFLLDLAKNSEIPKATPLRSDILLE